LAKAKSGLYPVEGEFSNHKQIKMKKKYSIKESLQHKALPTAKQGKVKGGLRGHIIIIG